VPNDPTTPTALTYEIRYAAVSDQTAVTIPNDVFEAGKLYTVRAHCVQGGFPMIGAGNFLLRDLPVSVGYLDSGVFTVQAP